MGKFFAGAFIVIVIAAIGFFVWSRVNDARQEEMQGQIAAMNKQISQMNDENTRLKTELAKVQTKEQNLVTQNQELQKVVGTVKATGKLPADMPANLAYPPK